MNNSLKTSEKEFYGTLFSLKNILQRNSVDMKQIQLLESDHKKEDLNKEIFLVYSIFFINEKKKQIMIKVK